ncbi:MAG: CRTAC1 family protein, partial [Cyclobacteriaceae bacterium]
RLYKQNANHSFTQISAGDLSTDVDEKEQVFWADYNKDGFSDILIISQDDPVRLYRNAGNETFTKVTTSGFQTAEAINAVWGDYNNDTNIDLFLSETTGNHLYLNNGDETFTKNATTAITEVSTPPGGNPSPAFTSAWGDYNNDGFLDLFIAGFFGGINKLFLRDPLATSNIEFIKVDNEKINDRGVGHFGLAHHDYDKDGFLDMGMSHLKFSDSDDGVGVGNNYLFKNNNTIGNWVELDLLPVNGNKSAIGSKITITAGGKTQFREVTGSTGLVSRNSLRVHFGLGSATTITSIEVQFPAGPLGPSITKTLTDQNINQIIQVSEDTDGPQVSTFTPKNRDKGFVSEEISITSSDAVSVASVGFMFRPIGGKDFVTEGMGKVGSTNEWQITIMEDWYDDMGLEFYFEATDPFGNKTRSPTTGNYYSYLNYKDTNAPKFPTTSLVFGGTDKTWNIVSI